MFPSHDPRGVTITSAGGGTGLKVNMAVTLASGITTLTISDPGSGYSVGDTITFASATFGGAVNAVVTLIGSDFNSGNTYGSTNFEISDSQQTDCILKILQYAGVIIRDPSIVQVAQQELMQDQANEKR